MPQIGSFMLANLVEKKEVYQPGVSGFSTSLRICRLFPRYFGYGFLEYKPIIELRCDELAICLQ